MLGGMSVEVRSCTSEEELVEAFRTVEVAFGEEPSEADIERSKKTMPVDRALVAVEDGRFVGVAAAWPFSMTVPGGELPCPGVTWVGVLPTHRRRGVLTAMMRFQLDDIHARGEPLAALWASESLIYGRFGYGIAAPVHELDAVKSRFAFRDDPGPVGSLRMVTREEAAELVPPVYERIRAQRGGMLSRSTTWWWESRLYVGPGPPGTGQRFFVVYEQDGEPEGYAFYRLRNKWENGTPQGSVMVVEALGATPTATRELWRFLFGIDLTERVESNIVDPASGLWLGVADPRRLGIKLGDGVWLRLVDVEAALAARSWASDDSLVLEVRDAFCPWNEGRYRTGEGRVDAEPDLVLSAADLASAYLGGVDVFALAAAGRVEERTSGAVARADALFRTSLPPFCPEVF
jgi:predicted acetyltransferase